MPKTLIDIIPPSKRRTMGDMNVNEYQSAPPPITSTTPLRTGSGGNAPGSLTRGNGFPVMTAVIALVVIVLAVGALFVFSGAEVVITPQVQTTRVDQEFTATSFVGDLPYEIVSANKTSTVSVPAESTQTANDPAQGSLTIYNSQSLPQALIKNTRFETNDGLIFRIRDSITVPKGSDSAPGSLVVTVYADEGGEKYNVGPGRFTLPGLKGSATYEKVYGKTTEQMSGGFSGERPSVSEAKKTAEIQKLRSVQEGELLELLRADVPEGFVFLPTSVFTTFETQPDGSSAQGTVDLRLKGTATAIVFPQSALAKAVAYKSLAIYGGEPVLFKNLDSLTLRPTEEALPSSEAEFTFTLTGEATLVWQVDPAKISGAVAGKKRDSAEAILSAFPEVDGSVMTLRPFWADTFPADPQKVKVIVKTP